MLIDAGLPSPTMLLFSKPIRVLLPQMNREPININNDNAKYEMYKGTQCNNNNNWKFGIAPCGMPCIMKGTLHRIHWL